MPCLLLDLYFSASEVRSTASEDAVNSVQCEEGLAFSTDNFKMDLGACPTRINNCNSLDDVDMTSIGGGS